MSNNEVYVVFGYDKYNCMSEEGRWFSSEEIFHRHISFMEVFNDRDKAVEFFKKKVIDVVNGYDLFDQLGKENEDELFVDESYDDEKDMFISYQEKDENLFWTIHLEDDECLPPDIRLVARKQK